MKDLIEAIVDAKKIVMFTGAGISTDSGIPDYRGTRGQYSRYQPVYYDEFIAHEEKRREYWAHKASVWPALRDALPGPAHELAVALVERSTLRGVITQNIDGLHEKAGLTPDRVVNLHGSNLEVECIDCGRRRPAGDVLDPMVAAFSGSDHVSIDATKIDPAAINPPRCPDCGGLLKPATVMFGQSLRPADLSRAEEMVVSCDLLLAMGSTLTVQPAASFPIFARHAGATLVIVTRGPTPLDDQADYRIDGDIAPFCRAVLAELHGDGR